MAGVKGEFGRARARGARGSRARIPLPFFFERLPRRLVLTKPLFESSRNVPLQNILYVTVAMDCPKV